MSRPLATKEFLATREFPDLIALDIDETVLPLNGNLPERVVDALAAATDAGITVVLATGRSLSTAAPVARAAGLDGWIVCSNGAVLGTVEPETVIDAVEFHPEPLIRILQEHVPDAEFAVEDKHGVFLSTQAFHAGALGLSIREVPLEHLLRDPVVRLVVRSEAIADTGWDEVIARTGVHTTIYGIHDVAWMDVASPGVDKAAMLAQLCTRLDLNPVRTITIGDGWNDVAMLRWAGTGIAMGHSPAGVIEAADAVCGPLAGEAVADVVEALLSR